LKNKIIYLLSLLSLVYSNTFSQNGAQYLYYNIQVELDVKKKTLEGSEIITWRNTTNDNVQELQLNIFHNAYRNSNSTFAFEGKLDIKKQEAGYTDINFIKVVDNYNSIAKINFIQPDDNNLADETVMQIILSKPVAPNQAIKLNIGFITKLPIAGIGRSGYARGKNFFLASEWYPKLGVYEEGKGWSCHQFHYWTDFFSNFALYDIGITLPENYSIGASFDPFREAENFNGTKTYQFKGNRLLDFAWFATDDILEFEDTFQTSKLPEVKIKVLLQKENREKIERIFYAIKTGLKYYGEWIGEFPLKTITYVDMPRSFREHAASYYGLCALQTNLIQLENDHHLEGKIFYVLGLQYFSSVLGINQTEESWIDEGISAYLSGKILQKCYGPGKGVIRIADGLPMEGISVITHKDYPVVAYMGFALKPYMIALKEGYLQTPSTDPISKPGWKYQNTETYRIGSIYKPALMLETMSNYFGSNLIFHLLKTYYSQYRFSYTGTKEWLETANSIFGRRISWFFEQVFKGTEVVDNSVKSIKNQKFKDNKYLVEIVFARKGAVQIPTDLKITLENGYVINDSWDCKERWIMKTYICDYPAVSAVIDPGNKITLDVNSSNNSYTLDSNYKPVLKWAGQWLFWMQTLLQSLCSIC